jgi:predicted ribosomally synthesized peptide with SipW-like signal peptide
MFRKIMIAVLLLGAAGAAIGAGTFASFTASTTNQTSTFATGTLTLSNTVGTATACLSSAGGVDTNANTGCDAILSSATGLKPGSAPSTGRLTLTNTGSITPSALQYAMSTCSPGNAAGANVSGTGNPCTTIEVFIQEYTSSAFDTKTGACIFPSAASNCATDFSASNDTLSNVPTTATTITGGLGTSRFFEISAQLPTSAGNAFQGRKADFAFTWNIVQ